MVLGRARKFLRSPLAASKKATVAWKSAAGLSSATAIVAPSGDQLGPPWYDSGSSTEASRRSLDASRSKIISWLFFSAFILRQNAIRLPSGEKVTRESTSKTRSRGVPPSDGTSKSARYCGLSGLRAR